MRILGRIVGVRSTEQSVGIKVGGGAFAPDIYIILINRVNMKKIAKKKRKKW